MRHCIQSILGTSYSLWTSVSLSVEDWGCKDDLKGPYLVYKFTNLECIGMKCSANQWCWPTVVICSRKASTSALLTMPKPLTVRTGHGTTDWFQIGKGVVNIVSMVGNVLTLVTITVSPLLGYPMYFSWLISLLLMLVIPLSITLN